MLGSGPLCPANFLVPYIQTLPDPASFTNPSRFFFSHTQYGMCEPRWRIRTDRVHCEEEEGLLKLDIFMTHTTAFVLVTLNTKY